MSLRTLLVGVIVDTKELSRIQADQTLRRQGQDNCMQLREL